MALNWQPDILGEGYEQAAIEMPRDYTGAVQCTLVRKLSQRPAHRAVVYVHGFSDYFFQVEEGNYFAERRWNFYAVDLRRYGRSILPGQTPFTVHDLQEYFPDIEEACHAAKADGAEEIVLMGHSTGGLICALLMAQEPPQGVKALVLNSPFLAWNKPWIMRRVAIPIVAALASIFPNIKLESGGGTAYGDSLHRDRHGRWDFRTDWKPLQLPKVQASWIRAIDRAQRWLEKHPGCIHVPVLLLHSAASSYGSKWTPRHNRTDSVLNAKEIAERGRRLAFSDVGVTDITIPGGMHDLALSDPEPRTKFYAEIANWLNGLHNKHRLSLSTDKTPLVIKPTSLHDYHQLNDKGE